MALNLKKGEEGNTETPSTKKMGLNLSKTDNSPKSNLNLSKVVTEKEDVSITSNDQFVEKKKSPITYILIAVLIFGIGGYYFMTKEGVNSNVSPISVDSTSTNGPTTTSGQSQTQGEIANLPGANESTVSTSNSNDIQNANSSNPPSTNKEPAHVETNSQNSTNSSASLEQKVREVIDGKFGNGEDRKLALGKEYKAIQAKVNTFYRSQRE